MIYSRSSCNASETSPSPPLNYWATSRHCRTSCDLRNRIFAGIFCFLLPPITVFVAILLKVIGVSIMHIFLFCNLNLCAIKVNLKSISWQCIRWTAGNILKKMKPKHLDRTLVADGSVGHKQTSPTRPTKTWISCQSLLRFDPFLNAVKHCFHCGTWYWELVVCLCFLHLLRKKTHTFLLPSNTIAARDCVSGISSS